jgi:hypothetical protein
MADKKGGSTPTKKSPGTKTSKTPAKDTGKGKPTAKK